MPKKHRVKRANYVKHLLEVEKKREAYIEKRKNRKRNRTERNEEDLFGEARDAAVQSNAKKRRQDPASSADGVKSENEEPRQAPSTGAPKVNPFAALQSASGAAVDNGFFDVSQSAPSTTSASAAAAATTAAAKKKSVSKKKY